MAATAFYGRITKKPSPVRIVPIMVTTGLGSNGNSFSITAATIAGVEDVRRGALPGLPKVHLHNPKLAYESGGYFHQRGRMARFRARRKHLHRMHHDRLPAQLHAANGRGAWRLPGAEMAPYPSRTYHRQSVWKFVIHGRSEES
jgi:hypothetical protein